MLYGLIDVGIIYMNNQGGYSLWFECSGQINGSCWGLCGMEDFGGGLKVIFVLENGFNIVNGMFGQNGCEFGCQVFVGLLQEQFGVIIFGC